MILNDYHIDLPYVSFGTKHDPNIEKNRLTAQKGEVIRIYYTHKGFLFYINNKKQNKAGWGKASDMIRLIKNKYPKGKVADLQFIYPEGYKNEGKLLSLINENVDESSFEKYLYQYLLCLI